MPGLPPSFNSRFCEFDLKAANDFHETFRWWNQMFTHEVALFECDGLNECASAWFVLQCVLNSVKLAGSTNQCDSWTETSKPDAHFGLEEFIQGDVGEEQSDWFNSLNSGLVKVCQRNQHVKSTMLRRWNVRLLNLAASQFQKSYVGLDFSKGSYVSLNFFFASFDSSPRWTPKPAFVQELWKWG